jgi:hypothetical protein
VTARSTESAERVSATGTIVPRRKTGRNLDTGLAAPPNSLVVTFLAGGDSQ